jgi:hypothetical protein
MGAAMGNVPSWVFVTLGVVSIFAGILPIVVGMVLLIASALKSGVRTYKATDAGDWGKWLEALSKLPQWAIAIVLGNLQIAIGLWLLGATLFGYKLLP